MAISLPNPATRIIQEPPTGAVPGLGVGNLVISVATAADAISPWGQGVVQRDRQLREFWPTEPHFASALFTTTAQYTAFSWSLKGPPRMVKISQDVLASSQMGQGWEAMLEPFLIDYFTQDNGAFLEIVRTDDEPRAPVVSLNHLDAARCERTGRHLEPVIYTDNYGRRHYLKWYNVLAVSEFPSPITEAYGTGYCALTRILRATQIMRDVGIVNLEKASGRFTRQVHLVSGVQTKIIEDAMMQKQAAADAAGFLRYIQPLIVASLDPTSRVSKETIDLASIPEDYDEQKSQQAYITLLAMAFGGDYQNYAPLPGGGLGSSSQSKVLNMKSRGKGPGLFMKRLERVFNFHGILPKTVTFSFGEQDVAQQMEATELRRARALEREIRIRSGEITPEVARQIALDLGDLDERYVIMMREENATDEVVGDDTKPFTKVKPGDVKPGTPGPKEPPGGANEQGGSKPGENAQQNTNQQRTRSPATNQNRTPGGPPNGSRA